MQLYGWFVFLIISTMHMNIGRVRKGELDPKNIYRPLQMSNLDINKMGLTK